MFTKKILLFSGLSLVLCSSAKANFFVTAQSSNYNWGYLYGYGPDQFQDNQSAGDSTLLNSGNLGFTESLVDNGSYLGTTWTAAMDWSSTNTYSITGSLSSASSISSAGSTSNSAVFDTANGGNNTDTDQTIFFSVSGTQDYHLTGILEHVGPINRNDSALFVYKDSGSGYQLINLWDGNTTIDTVGTFDTGNYKFAVGARSADGGSEFTHATWNYNLEAVPEPTGLLVLIPGLAALCYRRRK